MKLAVRLLLVSFLRAGRNASSPRVQGQASRRQLGRRAIILTGERAGARRAGSPGRVCPCRSHIAVWWESARLLA